MKIRDIIDCARNNLMRNKIRTIVNCIILVVGIFAFIVTMSLSTSIKTAAKKELLENASLCEVKVSSGGNLTENKKLDTNGYKTLSEIEHVDTAYPDLQFTVVFFKDESECGGAFVETRTQKALPKLLYGEKYKDDSKNCVVLPSKMQTGEKEYDSKEFLNREIHLQCTLYDKDGQEYIKDYTFHVSGIYDEKMKETAQNTIYVNWKQMCQLQAERRSQKLEEYLNAAEYNNVTLIVDNEKNVPKVRENIEKLGYVTYSILDQLDTIPGVAKYIEVIGSFLCIIILLTAIICIWTTTAQATKLRAREIGVMKAVGYTSKNITCIMFLESVITSVISEIIALVASYLVLVQCISRFSKNAQFQYMTAQISIEVIISTLMICIIVPIIGSVYPLYKGVNIPPVIALKD